MDLAFGLCLCVFQYGKGELKFSSLTFDDSGMYQCLAENYWGIKYANAELRVIGETFEETFHSLFNIRTHICNTKVIMKLGH